MLCQTPAVWALCCLYKTHKYKTFVNEGKCLVINSTFIQTRFKLFPDTYYILNYEPRTYHNNGYMRWTFFFLKKKSAVVNDTVKGRRWNLVNNINIIPTVCKSWQRNTVPTAPPRGPWVQHKSDPGGAILFISITNEAFPN